MVERLIGLAALTLVVGCGGGTGATDTETPGGGSTSTGTGSASSDEDSTGVKEGDSGTTGELNDCRSGYGEFERAWSVWFETELEDAEAAAVVTDEWIKQLPMKSELEEMAQVAEELRYEPGFDLWIVALSATEDAIALCGEGAANPGA